MLTKLISKKFFTLCIATGLLWFSKLNGTEWLIIAVAYMGVESGLNILEKYMSLKK